MLPADGSRTGEGRVDPVGDEHPQRVGLAGKNCLGERVERRGRAQLPLFHRHDVKRAPAVHCFALQGCKRALVLVCSDARQVQTCGEGGREKHAAFCEHRAHESVEGKAAQRRERAVRRHGDARGNPTHGLEPAGGKLARETTDVSGGNAATRLCPLGGALEKLLSSTTTRSRASSSRKTGSRPRAAARRSG